MRARSAPGSLFDNTALRGHTTGSVSRCSNISRTSRATLSVLGKAPASLAKPQESSTCNVPGSLALDLLKRLIGALCQKTANAAITNVRMSGIIASRVRL